MPQAKSQSLLRAAAWVPDDDPERPWDEAADLAAEWIWARAEEEGKQPMLVTNTFQNGFGIASLNEITGAGRQATPRSRGRFEPGPVLAYVPVEKALDLALDLARESSLVVVETINFPVSEWAAAIGAFDLIHGLVSLSAIPDDVRADLEHAIHFGGNNGWSGPHEKKQARTFLFTHVASGRLDADTAAAYAMANNVSDRGAKRLRALIESMER